MRMAAFSEEYGRKSSLGAPIARVRGVIVVIFGYAPHEVPARVFQAVAELGKVGRHQRFTNRRSKWNFVV